MLGGACWATGFVVLGYLAGSQYKRIEQYANYIGIGLLVIIAAYFLARRLKGRRPGNAGTASRPPQHTSPTGTTGSPTGPDTLRR